MTIREVLKFVCDEPGCDQFFLGDPHEAAAADWVVSGFYQSSLCYCPAHPSGSEEREAMVKQAIYGHPSPSILRPA